MPKGRVKWFNNAKGYGFILPTHESNEEDLFIHYSAINIEGYKTLKAGQVVSYDIVQGPKGLHAINISPVQHSEDHTALYEETSESHTLEAEEVV